MSPAIFRALACCFSLALYVTQSFRPLLLAIFIFKGIEFLTMIAPSSRTDNFHYAIRNIVRAAEEHERAGRQVIYLNIGDPQIYGFRPPEHLIEAVTRALHDRFTGYASSKGLLEAREAVAAYATGLGARTEPDHVFITSGASEAADLVLTALVNPGEEVLIPAPGYPLYPAILNKLGARPIKYRLYEENGWQPSSDEIESLIGERTRAIVLINPSNPTGAIIPDAVVARLLEIAARHRLLVIADEVYRELCFADRPTPASVLAKEIGTPLVTLESLSKTHLVPGWRVGWMRFTHAGRLQDLTNAILRLAGGRLCAPTPTQYAIRPALEGDRSFQLDFMCELKRRRDLALSRLSEIRGLSCVPPQAAFYMMIKVKELGGRTDERLVLDLLRSTDMLVVHGSGFGADPREGYFRLVYLPDERTLDLVFDRLKSFMMNWRAS